jgi:hypothetical protein
MESLLGIIVVQLSAIIIMLGLLVGLALAKR